MRLTFANHESHYTIASCLRRGIEDCDVRVYTDNGDVVAGKMVECDEETGTLKVMRVLADGNDGADVVIGLGRVQEVRIV